MCFKNTINAYGVVAKTFHWLMALLIISMLALGFYMNSLSMGPDKFKLIRIHKSIGIIILVLVALRLVWKSVNLAPLLPVSLRRFETFLAHAGHAFLYVLMFATPLSGWIMSSAMGFPVSVFAWFTLPNLVSPDGVLKRELMEVHTVLAWIIIVTVSLHVLAALLHHFYYRNNVLVRMLPFGGDTRYAADHNI